MMNGKQIYNGAFAFVFCSFASIANAEPISIRAEVNGMVCAFCAQGIDVKLRKNAATKDVYVNLKNRVVAVQLKEGTTFSLESFKSDILESGYAVTKVAYVNESVSSIKAAVKAINKN
jgi:periplasmic mercuric ion binding protein